MSDRRRVAYLAGGIPLGLLLLIVAAWGIDTATSSGQVARNVVVADRSVTGLEYDELVTLADEMTTGLRQETVIIDLGDDAASSQQTELDPVTLGARVDGEALAEAALDERRGGFILVRPFRWLAGLVSQSEVEVPYSVDEAAAIAAADSLAAAQLTEPTEPYLEVSESWIVVVPGADGATIDADELIDEIEPMMTAGTPYRLALTPVPLAPGLSSSQLERVADEANEATANGITIRVLDASTTATSDELRGWIVLDTSDDIVTWAFDEATLIAGLEPKFPSLGGEDQQARFDVVDGVPTIIPASETIVCCAADSGQRLKAALLSDAPTQDVDDGVEPAGSRSVELQPEISAGGAEGVRRLEELGIVEEVATFTTRHDCCQNRVTNIQLMADIVKGTIVRPGETFSLNGNVGKRTPERGFLPAGAIAQGVLEDQVGGGVSQFTTTIFNAVFFAGLDFVEYQSHSLYFSRYPRGREATVSWPKPDFKFTNNTPYGVLIWPSYTDTSITVTLYSTTYIEAEDIGRTESAQGACTRVTTTRERTWPDNRSETDTVFAVYRPSAGLDCAGNSTIPTTTTVPENPTSSTEGTETTEGEGDTTTTSSTTPTTTSSTTETSATTAAEE